MLPNEILAVIVEAAGGEVRVEPHEFLTPPELTLEHKGLSRIYRTHRVTERERLMRKAVLDALPAGMPVTRDALATAIEAARPFIAADALRDAASASPNPLVTVAELRHRAAAIEKGEVPQWVTT